MRLRVSGQFDWLVWTKVWPPLLRGDVISRPRLLTILRDGLLSYRLTLLSAAAGYGKTTLLATLLAAYPDIPLAWLTLDEGDNDPALFLAYLIAALRRLEPGCGTTAWTLLADLPSPTAQARRVIGVLVNDILETMPDPFALVLDDLHLVVDPVVYSALDYLLERLPPQMHLVIATRRDPPLSLSRLRARRELVELRVDDLRFTAAETAAFLNGMLHLGLSSEDLAILQRRTEGWPVGLYLLAESLSDIPTPAGRSDFIAHLSQTDRYVFDFLADEVLNRQPPEIRTFLLDTSILAELTPSLCRAVTGREDAGEILEDLDRRSLFLVALNQERTIFRYHALFAEFLRRRLGQEAPGRITNLHRRAAEAQVAEHPHRAIGHYLAAEMWDEAAVVVEQIGKGFLHRGWVNIPAGWFRAMPVPVWEAHPRLIYFLGICTELEGNLDGALMLLERALRAFRAIGDERGQGEVLTDLALYALLEADFESSSDRLEQALKYPLSLPDRVQLLMGRAWLGIVKGDMAQAGADLDTAMELTRESGDSDVAHLIAVCLSAPFIILPGALDHIEYLARWIATSTERIGKEITPALVAIEGLTAFAHLWRGRLERGIQVGNRALAFSRQIGGFPLVDIELVAFMAVAHAARGDDAAADRFFDLLFHERKWMPLDEVYISAYLYMLGRARWGQGRLDEAHQVYAQMEAAANPREVPIAPTLRLMMRGLLEMSARRYAEADRFLRRAVAGERANPTVSLFGSPRLILARLHLERDRPRDALAELTPVLEECQRSGTPGLILKEGAVVVPLLRLAMERGVYTSFASHLLDILGAAEKPRPVRVPETGEILTSREIEVLRLVTAGETNRAIAAQLLISAETVKTHVSHILRKLNVSSRTQAAVRARELGIPPAPPKR